jgi:ribosomal protein S18 acetylase RimI-like enzyme
MTDVLGTLLAWDARTCVVAPESGPAVTIALADIVAGKPVPPRGSVRQRVSVREAEVRALPLWISPTTESLGDWVLRVVTGERGRGSRRANSCLAVGDPGMPVLEAAARVEAFYAGYGRVATMQVETGSPVDEALAAAGWDPGEPEDAPYLVGSLVMALRAAGSGDGVVASVEGTRVLATVTRDGVEIGRGRAELNDDWLGVHGLRVDESARREGLGRRLMAGLLEAGAELGARTLWLEVDRCNTPAWMLYAGLGLREHHRCHYVSPRLP